jgi:hypothetical protein
MSERPVRKMAGTFFVSAILVFGGSFALVAAVRLLRSIALFIGIAVAVVVFALAARFVRRRRSDKSW